MEIKAEIITVMTISGFWSGENEKYRTFQARSDLGLINTAIMFKQPGLTDTDPSFTKFPLNLSSFMYD